ncbi:unnamed protein product [Lasius platythorax]|uniref:Uncharacterized protein n=1 Tax=Lasius platythorax TaxID=488582 RepID=A0AAV2P9R0_9HYME
MPLCGAVTKLTRPALDADGCTLRTPAAVPTVSVRREEGGRGRGGEGRIDSGRKESRKSSAEGDWRRCTQTLSSSLVKGEGETWRNGYEQLGRRREIGRDAKAEEVRGDDAA